MPTYTATGITLIARKYGDTGRVVSFCTRERGKVEAVARGVGKPASRLAAAVEPFTMSKLFFAEGRDLDRLTQAEVIEAHLPLRHDMRLYAYGAYLLELTNVTTEVGQAHPELFDDLAASLAALMAGDDAEIITWGFTLRLLVSQGSAPEVDVCVECGGELKGRASYAPGQGGFICQRCSPTSEGRLQVSGAALGALRSLATMPIARLNRVALKAQARREVSRVIRAHTDYHVGDNLKSRAFLEKMARDGHRVEEGNDHDQC